jgi:hypothetical protein
MSCIIIRCTYDKNLDPAISSGVALFCVFSLAPWWPSQESDWIRHSLLWPPHNFAENCAPFLVVIVGMINLF